MPLQYIDIRNSLSNYLGDVAYSESALGTQLQINAAIRSAISFVNKKLYSNERVKQISFITSPPADVTFTCASGDRFVTVTAGESNLHAYQLLCIDDKYYEIEAVNVLTGVYSINGVVETSYITHDSKVYFFRYAPGAYSVDSINYARCENSKISVCSSINIASYRHITASSPVTVALSHGRYPSKRLVVVHPMSNDIKKIDLVCSTSIPELVDDGDTLNPVDVEDVVVSYAKYILAEEGHKGLEFITVARNRFIRDMQAFNVDSSKRNSNNMTNSYDESVEAVIRRLAGEY